MEMKIVPGCVSFEIAKIHSHDLATILDIRGICVRAGHHCAMPLHTYLNSKSTVRISIRNIQYKGRNRQSYI